MKFIVSTSTLLKQLNNLSGALSSSNALPILDNFLFSLNKNKLDVSASDLETTIITTISVESKDTDSVAIPARLLMDMLKAMPDQPLTFSIDKKNFAITVSSAQGSYKLTGHDAQDFPKAAEIDSATSFEIDSAILSRSISKTSFAAGTDDLRPAMCGVFFQMETDGMTLAATDAHKLVRYKRDDIKSKKASSFIIPRKPLSLLKNILVDGKVKVEYNTTNVSFTVGNSVIVCRLVDAKFPNYDAVIPKENPNVLSIDRSILANSVKRIAIFANKTTSQVRLDMKGGKLTVTAEDLDFSNEASEQLECEYKGEDLLIGFNAKWLSEILSNIDSEEITVEMSTANRAGIIKPKVVDKGEDVLMLLMPVLLNN